jgi:hypothetical protein
LEWFIVHKNKIEERFITIAVGFYWSIFWGFYKGKIFTGTYAFYRQQVPVIGQSGAAPMGFDYGTYDAIPS